MERLSNNFKKINLPVFWITATVINVIVGTIIGVVRLSFNDVKTIDSSPPFVILSRQTNKIHKDLYEKIDQTNKRVNVIEQKVEYLDKHIRESREQKNRGTKQ